MYLTIIYLPLITAIVVTMSGRVLGQKQGAQLACIGTGLLLVLSIIATYEVCIGGSPVILEIGPWTKIYTVTLGWGLYIDSLSTIMLTVISCISLCVQVYSTEYMKGDPHLPRFMGYLSAFTGFMVVLVSAPTLVQLFVGWEGIGIVSYLLVNFWYTRGAANRASMMALLTNRVGDWGYTIALLIVITLISSVQTGTLFNICASPIIDNTYITYITLALLIGVMGKSAQLGLHTWLPWAMEGPTPVSALLHAATLVTAGVYLLLRISPLLEFSDTILSCIRVLGGLTAIVGGSLGLVSNDMKKVIAYSTLSQLGYIVYAIGISAYHISLYHLVNHAFFKALLFLSAGSIIHAIKDEQDLRKIGSLKGALIFTYVCMTIGSISLMGFPFTTGFYSKEPILLIKYASISGGFGYILCLTAALFTAIYGARAVFAIFFAPFSISNKTTVTNVHEGTIYILLPLAFLAVSGVILGYLGSDYFLNGGPYTDSIFLNAIHLQKAPLYFGGASLPLLLTFIGILIAFIIYVIYYKPLINLMYSKVFKNVYILLSQRYFFDIIFNGAVSRMILSAGSLTAKCLDKGFGEMLGPFGLHKKAFSLSLSVLPSFIKHQSPIFYGGLFITAIFISIFICIAFDF